jgi:hypothetical protein
MTISKIQGLVVLILSSACQPDRPTNTNTSDGQDSHASGKGDELGPDEDPWDCGEMGLTCIGPLGIGSCVEGECQGRLTMTCYPPDRNCDEICADLGATCAPQGCEGATAWVWNASTKEEADYLCLAADRDAAEALAIGCDEELTDLAMSVNCCCKW